MNLFCGNGNYNIAIVKLRLCLVHFIIIKSVSHTHTNTNVSDGSRQADIDEPQIRKRTHRSECMPTSFAPKVCLHIVE